MTDPNHQDPPGTDLPREEPPTLSAADPPSAASLPSTAGLSTDETADGALLEIPGRPHPVHEPEAPELDLKGLLADLLDSAQRESSAATKSRALLVASDLSLFLGRRDVAVETARSAADIAPKSALAATQARALGVDDQEGLIRRLETTMRLAESAPSRTHIALQLAAELSRQGSTLKASGVLDHIARLGSLDMRVQLQRLLTRLTSGEPLGGLALSSPLKEKGEAIEELLGGSEAQLGASEAQLGASEAQDPRAYLEYFRVAKELRHARVSDAMRVLDAGHLEPERKGELLSAHAARLPGGLEKSKRLLEAELERTRSPALLRSLVARALELGEPKTVLRIVGELDSDSETFSGDERRLLTALAAGPGAVRSASWVTEPGAPLLDRALTFFEDCPEDPGGDTGEERQTPGSRPSAISRQLSDEERLIRRGLLLGRLETTGLESALLKALEQEMDERMLQVEILLTRLLELRRAVLGGQRQETPACVARLAHAGSSELWPVAALLAEELDDPDGAQQSYKSYLATAAGSGEAALALRRLAESALTELAPSSPPDPHLTGAHDAAGIAEVVLRTESETEAFHALSHWDEQLAARLRRPVAIARELLAGTLELQSGRPTLPPLAPEQRPRDRVSAGMRRRRFIDIVLATARILGRVDVDPEAPRSLFALASSAPWDQSLATLSRFHHRASQTATDAQPESAWLGAWDVARICLTEPPLEAAESLKRFSGPAASPVAIFLEEALRERGGDLDSLSRHWLDQTREASEPLDRRFAYEQLARVDELRGNRTSALLWQRTILEEFPRDLRALSRIEAAHLDAGEVNDWLGVQARILEALPAEAAGADIRGLRSFAAHLALAKLDISGARRALGEIDVTEGVGPLPLRILQAGAREARDDRLLADVSLRLFARATTDLDQTATLLDAACAHARLGGLPEARSLVERAREIREGDFASELFALRLLEAPTPVALAEQLESLANAAAHPRHCARLLRAAGVTWQEAEDQPRARACYERCLAHNPESNTAFERLREIYRSLGERKLLAELLKARVALAPDAPERRDYELELAPLLIALGTPEEAKARLEEVLLREREDISLLRAHAEVAAELGEHQAAERSLASLSQRLSPGPARSEVFRALGRLYEKHLSSLEKAMDAYEAVIAAEPDDLATSRVLVDIYCKLSLAERATHLLTRIIQSDTSPDAKRRDALRLAELYETVASDPKRASATLERTRRAWPLDADVLEATAQFMQRNGQASGVRMMIDRTGKEVVRKLAEGHIDPTLLDTLARVRRLSGQHEAEALINAVRAAYVGEESPLVAAGVAALKPELENYLSPRALPAPLRTLLRKTGAALDAAFPIDLSSMQTSPRSEGRIWERLQGIASALGVPVPELLVTEQLGAKTVPLTVRPSRLLVGSELEKLDDDVIDFLLLRVLKLQQLGGGALSRSRPEDAWPMLVALLHIFAPSFQPQKVDGRKLAQARALIEQGLGRVGYDDDVPTLVLETIGALGRDEQAFSGAPRLLATRSATLATFGPYTALRALGASSKKSLPEAGPSRFRWIAASDEARDVLLFCTSDAFFDARRALGLPARTPGTASGTTPDLGSSPGTAPAPPRPPSAPRSGDGPPRPPPRRT